MISNIGSEVQHCTRVYLLSSLPNEDCIHIL